VDWNKQLAVHVWKLWFLLVDCSNWSEDCGIGAKIVGAGYKWVDIWRIKAT
jgi:hypothetical protein